ncbi:MAG: tetratricopeptide repeat protein [Acidobacteriota bacterium]
MRLTDLREQTVRNEGFRFAYLRKTKTPQEASGLRRLMTAPFLIRYLLWCEENLATHPEKALPWALEATNLVATWERLRPDRTKDWIRFKVRAHAVRGIALRIQHRLTEADLDYQNGLLCLAENRSLIPDGDAIGFYLNFAGHWLYQDKLSKTDSILQCALKIAERSNSRDDISCCHAMLGSMHLRASLQQKESVCLAGNVIDNRQVASYHLNLSARQIDARKDKRFAYANLVNLATLAYLESTTERRQALAFELDETRRAFVRRKLRISFLICKFDWLRGLLYRNLGETATARKILRRCRQRFAKFDTPDTYLSVTLDLADLERRSGNHKAARTLAEEATPFVERYIACGSQQAEKLHAWHQASLQAAPDADRLLATVRSAFGAFPDQPSVTNDAAAATAAAGWAKITRAAN